MAAPGLGASILLYDGGTPNNIGSATPLSSPIVIDVPDNPSEPIEAPNLAISNRFIPAVAGLQKGGTPKFTAYFLKGDYARLAAIKGFSWEWAIVLPADGVTGGNPTTTFTFFAFLTELSMPVEVDKLMVYECKLKINSTIAIT